MNAADRALMRDCWTVWEIRGSYFVAEWLNAYVANRIVWFN
jgi:hypothetical protein